MTLPIDEAVYYRAANQPRPADWVEPILPMSHTRELGVAFAANGLTYFADWSEFQPYYDSSYPYLIACFRAHSGYNLDQKVTVNWSRIKTDLDTGHLKMAIAYVVFIPGAWAKVFAGLQQVFGAKPDARVAFMVDMESGSGFAGPGNHSTEANQWVASLRAYAGNPLKAYGYANNSDWNGNWPSPAAGMLRHIAAYNAKDPSPYGWQYAGGNPQYPSPAGYPRTCAPFGAYIDMNVINLTIDEVLVDFGVTTPAPLVLEEQMSFIVTDGVAGEDPSGVQYHTDLLTTLSKIDSVMSGWLQSNGVTLKAYNQAQLGDLVGDINDERASRGWTPYVIGPNGWYVAAPLTPPAPGLVTGTIKVDSGSIPVEGTITGTLNWDESPTP